MKRPRQRGELAALTSLRFFAALYVVVFHYSGTFFSDFEKVGMLALGYSGVTFFFILSGFILAYTYADSDFSDQIMCRQYFFSRFARIMPVYLLALSVGMPFFIVKVMAMEPDWYRWLYASSGLLAPLGLHAWVPGAACALNCPSWSISTELYFYLVFPFVLPMIGRKPERWLVFIALGWLAMYVVASLLWVQIGAGPSILEVPEEGPRLAEIASQAIKYWPLGRLPEFLLGIVLFMYWRANDIQVSNRQLLALSALIAIVFVTFQSYIPQVMMHNGLTAVFWVPLIIVCARMRTGILTGVSMVFLGRISFALYLFHTLVSAVVVSADKRITGGALLEAPWLASGITIFLAIGISAFVYLFIEEPARKHLINWWRSTKYA